MNSNENLSLFFLECASDLRGGNCGNTFTIFVQFPPSALKGNFSSFCPKRKFPPTNTHTFDLNFYLLSKISILNPLALSVNQDDNLQLTIKEKVLMLDKQYCTRLDATPCKFLKLSNPDVLISSLSQNCFGK